MISTGTNNQSFGSDALGHSPTNYLLPNDSNGLTAEVLVVLLADGFAHRTQYLVAGKILLRLAVAAAVVAGVVAVLVAGGQAVSNSMQHVVEEEVEVVEYLPHTHKASQPDQLVGHIDLLEEPQEIKVVVEVEVEVEQQRDLASDLLVKGIEGQ